MVPTCRRCINLHIVYRRHSHRGDFIVTPLRQYVRLRPERGGWDDFTGAPRECQYILCGRPPTAVQLLDKSAVQASRLLVFAANPLHRRRICLTNPLHRHHICSGLLQICCTCMSHLLTFAANPWHRRRSCSTNPLHRHRVCPLFLQIPCTGITLARQIFRTCTVRRHMRG